MTEKMDNNIIKILIPVIAVVIIFESVILVSNLEKNTKTSVVTEGTPTEVMETKIKKDSFDINLSTDETQMKIGKKYKVSVNLTAKENINLNALDLYVKFDPAMLTVSGLTALKELPTPDLIKVSDKKDVAVLNYLFTEKDGQAFTKDKVSTVLTFMVTPKAEGSASLEVSNGDKDGDSVTMLVDKTTSESLLFSSNKLDLLLTK